MLAASQEIDFDQMDLAGQQLGLLAEIGNPPFRARGLVRGAEQFNGTDEPALAARFADIEFNRVLTFLDAG